MGIKLLSEECAKLKGLLEERMHQTSQHTTTTIIKQVQQENSELKHNMQLLLMELEESSVLIENKRKKIAILEDKLKRLENSGGGVEHMPTTATKGNNRTKVSPFMIYLLYLFYPSILLI